MISNKNREYNLDLVKFIAIIATIAIHIFAQGALTKTFSKTWYYFIFAGSFFRYCVPMFCIASGYLLYTRDEIDSRKIFNKIIRFLFYFIVAEALYRFSDFLYIKYYYKNTYVFSEILGDLLNGNFRGHLYYIFIIIMIYLFAPIATQFVKNENKELRYLLLLWIFISLTLVFIINIFKINTFKILKFYELSGAYNYIFFALLGAYFRKYKEKFLEKNIFIYLSFFIISLTMIIFSVIKMSGESTNFYVWDTNNILIFALSFNLFAILMKINIKSDGFKKFLVAVSKNTFVIYLIHVFFVDFINIYGLSYTNFDGILKIFIPFIEIGIVFIFSLLISVILKLIKNKILNF